MHRVVKEVDVNRSAVPRGEGRRRFLACAYPSVLLVIAIDARTVIPIVGRYLALTVFRGLFED